MVQPCLYSSVECGPYLAGPEADWGLGHQTWHGLAHQGQGSADIVWAPQAPTSQELMIDQQMRALLAPRRQEKMVKKKSNLWCGQKYIEVWTVCKFVSQQSMLRFFRKGSSFLDIGAPKAAIPTKWFCTLSRDLFPQ